MNIPTIAMLVAVIVLFGGACFIKNRTLNFLLQAFGFVALLGLIAVVGNAQNNFSGFVVFLLVSIAPQFLHLFDMESYIKAKQEKQKLEEEKTVQENVGKQESSESQQNVTKQDVSLNEENKEEVQETEIEENSEIEEKPKKNHFLTSKGDFLSGIANLITAGCITFAGLYLGLETFYGALFGVATGFALMFLYLALKKEINKFDLFGATLSFLAIGLLLGSIITVILYSTSLTNILFSAGCLVIAIGFGLKTIKKTKFDGLIYAIGMICLIATLIF